MNKKAFIVQDLLFMGLLIVIFIIAVIVGGSLLKPINRNYQTLNPTNNGSGQQMLDHYTDRYSKIWDDAVLVLFIFLVISFFFTMFLIQSHPVLFFILIVIFAIGLVVLAMFGNIFDRFIHTPAMAEEAPNYPITSFIMDHWVSMMLMIGIVGIIIFFAKINSNWFGGL